MDTPRPIPLRAIVQSPDDDGLATLVDTHDIVAAIELVALGLARRVVLVNIPDVEILAPRALAEAQAAGVAFALSRDPHTGSLVVIVGPRDA